MLTWQQNYDPFGNWVLSTAVSSLPVLTLFFVLIGKITQRNTPQTVEVDQPENTVNHPEDTDQSK